MRALLLAAIALAGCGRATDDPGLDALLRLSSAQFYRGAPPVATDGPMVAQLLPSPTTIIRGAPSGVAGSVPRGTTAVAVYLDGDVGYWIVNPGNFDPLVANQLNFSTGATYAQTLPAGTFTVKAQAADARGHFGPAVSVDVKTNDVTPADTLLVSLKWDTEADLDLHLVTPDGTEVWANKINSQPPPVPGQPSDPNGFKNGGILDFDSNGNCMIDGRREENIFWTVAPPSGHYIARVDTYSMCGEYIANWRLAVTFNDGNLGQASGFGRDSDAQLPHGAGQGVTALEFDIP